MKKLGFVLGSAALFATVLSANELNFKGLEISPLATYNIAEGNLDLKDRPGYGLRIGHMYDKIGAELGYEYEKGKYKSVGNEASKNVGIHRGYLNAILPRKIGNTKFDIYALAGLGYEHFSETLYDNKDGMFGHYGAGLKYKITDSFGLRAEIRDQIKFRHADHHLIATLGFIFNFGGKKEEPVIAAPVVEPEIIPEEKPALIQEEKPKACYDLELVNIYFGFDKSDIEQKYIPEIKRLAQMIIDEPAYYANISGFTDSTGSDAYNKKLSEKRANALKYELAKAGVSEYKINPSWYGKDGAVASNKTKEGRAKNRRVELRIICK